MSPNCGNASLKNACKKVGLPYGRKITDGIIFHDFRRTVKTNMVKAGVEKVYRDLILGHRLHGMDVYYIAPTDEDLKFAMTQYTRWLDAQIENVDQSVDHTIIEKL